MAVPDEVIYVGLLIISIPFGHVLKCCNGSAKKQLISTLAGVTIVISVCGYFSLHSLITILVNCLIVKVLGPKRCHIVSFIWCFGYILFFRLVTIFGLPSVPPVANAIQLVLTLKLVGIAFEIHDSYTNQEMLKKSNQDNDHESLELQEEYQRVNPTLLDTFSYCYCYIGILTGPYYKYRTYHDMIHETTSNSINTLTPLLQKLKWLPVSAACFFLLSHFFSIKYTLQDEFYDEPFWFRMFYMTPMFTIFRLRFYCAWYLAEAMCITAALGAYPTASKPRIGKGPTDYKALKGCEQSAPEGINYSFETMRNISPYGCEFETTVRTAMKAWNMTVQYWMASIVYKRLPLKSAPLKAAITMFVSAYWHGIHPGYYMSLLTTIPCMIAEDMFAAAFRNSKPYRQQQIFDGLCWFVRCRSLDYMCMGFLLLTFSDTYRYWSSIYFAAHVWTAVLLVIGYFIVRS